MAIVVLIALLLSACGSSGTSPGSSTQSAPSAGKATQGKAPEGAEESFEKFGSEASGGSRASVLAAFHGYLNAVGNEELPEACARLAQSVRQSLVKLGGGKAKGAECGSVLTRFLASGAPAMALQQTRGTVTRVRVKRGEAFVLFRAPGARLYEMTMTREGGTWKAGAAMGSVLVPAG